MFSVSDLRKYKLGDVVIFDFFGTIFMAIMISQLIKVPAVIVTVALLILGEVLHYWFRVPSNTIQYLGKIV